MTYEEKIRGEVAEWNTKMSKAPSFTGDLSKKIQTKINQVIPDKVHKAITAAISNMTRALLNGSELTSSPPLQNVPMEVRETLVHEKIKFYRNTSAAEVYSADSVLLGRYFIQERSFLKSSEIPEKLKHTLVATEDLRKRSKRAMESARQENSMEIEKIKWLQYIFSQQWLRLRKYCNEKAVSIVGDIPFYVGYDSSDVWANQNLFAIDRSGKLKAVAGVPPDYFNENGQLWGMPVFRWNTLRKTNYKWWIERLRKNIELYDIVRLDHFRAFADYWEVNSREKTAKRGKWKPGPGREFFEVAKSVFATMPFIAEDLGDINDKVTDLRDHYHLPGMKILQFAFGDNMATSDYIPHTFDDNFFVYTGTHDNNTTKGWFRKDIGKTERSNLARYAGIRVKENSVNQLLIRLAYSSVAKVAIIPMQDLLDLDERARMNVPASTKGNWSWRISKVNYSKLSKDLGELVEIFGR